MPRSSRRRMKWRRRYPKGFVRSGVSMLNRLGLIVRGLAAALLVLAFARAAIGDERRLPVPAVTISPGRDDQGKTDDHRARTFRAGNLLGVALFVEGRQILIGRMARRTLLSRPTGVPTNAVEDPWTVARHGSTVKVHRRGRRPVDRNLCLGAAIGRRRRSHPGPQRRHRRDHQGHRPAGRHRKGRGDG